MRQGQHKQRSRGRGRKVHNPANRSYDSNGPDVKIRGNAAHIAEKYSTLARDAQVSGDRIASENYLQHAEHYNRIVAASQAHTQQQQAQQQAQQQQAQQASPQLVTIGQDVDTTAEVEATETSVEKPGVESDDVSKSEEEAPKVQTNKPRQNRRRSPTGRNGSGARNKNAAAESDEAPAPKPEAESPGEAPSDLDQTAAE
jgi:Domain of unknown function (DUF4167)